jgi:hypothetical protein
MLILQYILGLVVALEHATRPFKASDFSGGGRSIYRLDDFVTESLMIPLAVVVLNVFVYSVLQ